MTDQQILIEAIEKAGIVIAEHISASSWRVTAPEPSLSGMRAWICSEVISSIFPDRYVMLRAEGRREAMKESTLSKITASVAVAKGMAKWALAGGRYHPWAPRNLPQ